jgi:membrane protease subunit HflC
MKAGKIVAGILVLIGVVAYLSVIIVKEVNQGIILQFCYPKRKSKSMHKIKINKSSE